DPVLAEVEGEPRPEFVHVPECTSAATRVLGPKGSWYLEADWRTPRVAERHLVHRTPRRDDPLAGGIAEADARRDQPSLFGGHAQDLKHLVAPEDYHRRQRCADSLAARREHTRPR